MTTKSLIVTDIIFTVFEVASIAKDWRTRDATIKDIDKLTKEIQKFLLTELSTVLPPVISTACPCADNRVIERSTVNGL
uniref:Secreted protein n=1 Tax=Mesocestoides corti TaxID=53468 RepID=A0A5K3FXA9_MESCO